MAVPPPSGLNTSHAESSVANTLPSPSRARFEMPRPKEAAASKGGKGGQLTIAAKMAAKHKAANEAIKVKAVAAKGKGSKRACDSSEGSGLEESESENSSAESSLPDIECSQKTNHTEGEKTMRRTKPDTPIIEVTFHFSIFVHSHVLI